MERQKTFVPLFISGFVACALVFSSTGFCEVEPERVVRETRDMHVAEMPGHILEVSEKAVLDISNSGLGYFGVRYLGDNKKVKVTVTKGVSQSIYDIPLSDYGEFVPLPFNMGDGEYVLEVWENLSGSQYDDVLKAETKISLVAEYSPFLFPSGGVRFDADSLAVLEAKRLYGLAESDRDFLNAVYKWTSGSIMYDYELEAAVQNGFRHVTDIDEVVRSGKGICIDFAVVMTAMLRSQGIPAKVMVGSMSGVNGEDLLITHAWISACLIDGAGFTWVEADPTLGSSLFWSIDRMPDLINYLPEYWY